MNQSTFPQPLRSDPNHHDYNFSGAVYDETTDYAPSTDEDEFPDHHFMLESTPSRHTSVSSFPASVVHHTPTYNRPMTPSRSTFHNARIASPNNSPRPHSTGFRHPSSVRALQMQDEFEFTDGEDLNPGHRRRNSKVSYLSYRSSGSYHSSPTKSIRMSRSAHTSPSKTRLKQEFPLVLLHCTLLPPALHMRAQMLKSEGSEKDAVLEAIIPEPYTKRWKKLQEKVVKNSEVKLRGILIPHPGDDYELLEERLLESLELERPKIREGHFFNTNIPDSATDSGFESGSTDSDSQHDGQQTGNHNSIKCPDCGHHISSGAEQERNWEIKVFAANGLMRAGAWSAAWNEMEKVDIEVSVWMPEEVRREVDERLNALIAKEVEDKSQREERRGMDDERVQEIYGESKFQDNDNRPSQAEIDGLADAQQSNKSTIPSESALNINNRPQPNLSTILSHYIQILAQDRRNIAILLLSMLVLYYGFSQGKTVSSTGDVQLTTDSLKATNALEEVVESMTTLLDHTTSMEIEPEHISETTAIPESEQIHLGALADNGLNETEHSGASSDPVRISSQPAQKKLDVLDESSSNPELRTGDNELEQHGYLNSAETISTHGEPQTEATREATDPNIAYDEL